MNITSDYIECHCELSECGAYDRCAKLPTSYWAVDGVVDLLFVSQGGGATESTEKKPLIGKAGQRLRQIITIAWKQIGPFGVAFSNTIRDCPPANRRPTDAELRCCLPKLFDDIRDLKGKGLKAVVLLGEAAKSAIPLMGLEGNVTRVHGQMREREGLTWMPTLHPSFLVRLNSMPRGQKLTLEKCAPQDLILLDDICHLVKATRENQ
jgi:uracil-DNA glycosylase family 4